MSDDKKHIQKKTFLDDQPRKTGQGTKKFHQIDSPAYQKKVEEVYQYILQGLRSNEIYAMLLSDDNSLTEQKFNKLLQYAYQYAQNTLHKDREYVFELHMDRYEDLYSKSMNMINEWYNTPLDPKKDWHIIVSRYTNAMKALKAKEDLIGLHDKSMVIEFNDGKAVVVEQDKEDKSLAQFDLDKLSDEEQIELLNLLKESRTIPIEGIQRVTIKKTVIEINTDTLQREQRQETINIDHVEVKEFEDMPEDVVSHFENQLPVEEVPEPEEGIIVKDSIPKGVKKKSFNEIQENLKATALEEFKKRLAERRNNRP